MDNLSELFRTARQYGLVDIFTSSNGSNSANITFNSVEHTELKAKSGYGHDTPESELKAAIQKAQEIVDSIQSMAKTLPERKLLK